MMPALLTNPFLQMALLIGFLASICGGTMGCFVVIRKITSITGSIAHSILGGIGFFLWLKYNKGLTFLDPIYGAFLAAFLSAFLIRIAHLRYRQNQGAIISMIWSSGMAIGVIFTSLIKGYKADLSNFLFGNILYITSHHIYILLVLDILLLLLLFIFYKKFLLICLDEEQAQLQKLRVHLLYFLLLSMISISIVLMIEVMGIILVIALITIPPTIANLFTSHLPKMMIISTIFCAFFILSGLIISYDLEWSPGATSSLLAGAVYILCLLLRSFIINRRKKVFT